MAKKSNKTEQVLKLITKYDDGAQDRFFEIGQEATDNRPFAIPSAVPAKISVKPVEEKEVKESKETGNASPQDNHSRDNEGSAFIEQHDHLINIAEILAKEKIALVMEKMKVCTCPTCVNDVLALTLNSLPTKYVTTDAGKQYCQLDMYKKQYETDILAALTKSCVRVKASPRH